MSINQCRSGDRYDVRGTGTRHLVDLSQRSDWRLLSAPGLSLRRRTTADEQDEERHCEKVSHLSRDHLSE